MKRTLTIVSVFLWISAACPAADWPHWRGPLFNGSSDEKGLPASWDEKTSPTWSTPLPGEAGSTPVIAQGRVFLTSSDRQNKNLYAICLDQQTGTILWKKTCGDANRTAPYNKDASPSPAVAPNRVWFLFGSGAFFAYDREGNELWRRDLGTEFGTFTQLFLYAASPLFYRDRLYVAVLRGRPDQPAPPQSADQKPPAIPDCFLLCLNPETGKTIWKQDRPTDLMTIESRDSYASPFPVELPGGRTDIILMGADYLTGNDGNTGRETWRLNYNTTSQTYRQRVCPTPVLAGDRIVAVKPRCGAAFAVPAGLKGTVPASKISWEYAANMPDVPSPLYYQGRLYLLKDKQGILTCLDPETGRLIWEGKLGGDALYHASPVGADGKIYCMNLDGEVSVVRAGGSDFRVLSRHAMGGSPAMSSVAIAGKRLFIRTEKNLTCIGATD